MGRAAGRQVRAGRERRLRERAPGGQSGTARRREETAAGKRSIEGHGLRVSAFRYSRHPPSVSLPLCLVPRCQSVQGSHTQGW